MYINIYKLLHSTLLQWKREREGGKEKVHLEKAGVILPAIPFAQASPPPLSSAHFTFSPSYPKTGWQPSWELGEEGPEGPNWWRVVCWAKHRAPLIIFHCSGAPVVHLRRRCPCGGERGGQTTETQPCSPQPALHREVQGCTWETPPAIGPHQKGQDRCHTKCL